MGAGITHNVLKKIKASAENFHPEGPWAVDAHRRHLKCAEEIEERSSEYPTGAFFFSGCGSASDWYEDPTGPNGKKFDVMKDKLDMPMGFSIHPNFQGASEEVFTLLCLLFELLSRRLKVTLMTR